MIRRGRLQSAFEAAYETSGVGSGKQVGGRFCVGLFPRMSIVSCQYLLNRLFEPPLGYEYGRGFGDNSRLGRRMTRFLATE